jgi:hypothetical protein
VAQSHGSHDKLAGKKQDASGSRGSGPGGKAAHKAAGGRPGMGKTGSSSQSSGEGAMEP